jgi:hypothetical protein
MQHKRLPAWAWEQIQHYEHLKSTTFMVGAHLSGALQPVQTGAVQCTALPAFAAAVACWLHSLEHVSKMVSTMGWVWQSWAAAYAASAGVVACVIALGCCTAWQGGARGHLAWQAGWCRATEDRQTLAGTTITCYTSFGCITAGTADQSLAVMPVC